MNDELKDRFALAPWTDLDWDVGAEGLVGVNLAADADTQRNILAVLAARRLGNRSIDYTRKTYGNFFVEHHDNDALIKEVWARNRWAYDRFYSTIPVRKKAPIGVFAFDLALIRARVSIDLLLYSARRGMLVESCLLARGILEQLAYAIAVWATEDKEIVFGLQPQSQIGKLRILYPGSARAYGILSKLCHYNPHEHFNFVGEEASVIQRSGKFKIAAISWLLFILDVKYRVFRYAYEQHPHFLEAEIAAMCGTILADFEMIFEDVALPSVTMIRELFDRTNL